MLSKHTDHKESILLAMQPQELTLQASNLLLSANITLSIFFYLYARQNNIITLTVYRLNYKKDHLYS
jgi:hypothetical protein